MQLLDLHGISRSEALGGVLTALKTSLLQYLREMSTEQLNILLEKMFPYIAQSALSDAVMVVLEAQPSVPIQYLRALRNAPSVLQLCPHSVRQQVWRMDRVLFASHVENLILQHVQLIPDDMLDRTPPNMCVVVLIYAYSYVDEAGERIALLLWN